MAAISFTPYYSFTEKLAEKVFNLGSDTLKIALSNTAPTLTHTQLSQVTQIAGSNGYTTGGEEVTISSSSQTTGTYTLVGTGTVTWTADGGAMGQFRYVILYDDDATNDELIGYYDHGSAVDLGEGDSYAVNCGATLITLASA
jgi:hypothetical protein